MILRRIELGPWGLCRGTEGLRGGKTEGYNIICPEQREKK